VAQVLDAFEEQNAKYIVMEYVRGQDLRSIVKKHGPRSERLVLTWAKEIAEIMLALHSQEQAILHRDLTPDNIMEDDKGFLRLIDFGAAHQLAEGVTGTLIGKQCYIAPEQLRGKASLRSDIYSFGCTLYFLLKGRDPVALRQCDLNDDGNNYLSADLNELVAKCTAFEETQRYNSFSEVIVALTALSSKANRKDVGSFNLSSVRIPNEVDSDGP
ncbi:MAG: serine/threonine protein kinase, partial [Candidatus Obscuribacterales bacterium]|nr:serine/threonine protein kinase [Candidatus Obscuribacterales bacterium]